MQPTRRLFLVLLLSSPFLGYGQGRVPGYVVTQGLDSLRGVVQLHDELAQQAQVDFIPLRGNQRLLLDAAQLRAYGYIRKQDTVRYVSVALRYDSTGRKTRRIFMQRLVGGPVELYKYYYTARLAATGPPTPAAGRLLPVANATTGSHPQLASAPFVSPAAYSLLFPPLSVSSARFGAGNSLLLYRRASNTITEITWWNFPLDAARYFADNPMLAADLKAKQYRANDIRLVLKRYNALRP